MNKTGDKSTINSVIETVSGLDDTKLDELLAELEDLDKEKLIADTLSIYESYDEIKNVLTKYENIIMQMTEEEANKFIEEYEKSHAGVRNPSRSH